MKRIYRSKEGAKIAGTCAGLGEVFHIDPVLLRVIFLILIPFGGIGLLTYIVAWIMVPQREGDTLTAQAGRRLTLSNKDRMIAGLCGGLGDYFRSDPVIFRVIFTVMLFMGGAGIVLYVLLWLVVPQSCENVITVEVSNS